MNNKRNDNYQRNQGNSVNTHRPSTDRGGRENYHSRDNTQSRNNNSNRDGVQTRENSYNKEGTGNRDNSNNRNYRRETPQRPAYSSYQGSQPRYNNHRTKAAETVDDIKTDILRIEKEIELEIKEIKSMRLGL